MILFLFHSNWIIMQQVPVSNIIMSMKSPRRYQLWKMAYSAISYDQAVLSARNLNILRWVFSAQKPTLIVMVCNVLLLYVYGEVEKFLLLRKHMGAKGSSTFSADRGIWKSRTRPGTCLRSQRQDRSRVWKGNESFHFNTKSRSRFATTWSISCSRSYQLPSSNRHQRPRSRRSWP